MATTVTLMCGPAGSGKTRYARQLEAAGATRLSFDSELWRRGFRGQHPAPEELTQQVDSCLRDRLVEAVLIGDVVLDYSFSTRAMREDYRRLIASLGARSVLVYMSAPLAVLQRRVAERRGEHADDVRLDPGVVDSFATGFEVPTSDEHPLVIETGDEDQQAIGHPGPT